jgi:hypothetical protein
MGSTDGRPRRWILVLSIGGAIASIAALALMLVEWKPAPEPRLTLSPEVVGVRGEPIHPRAAPFIVRVKGTAAHVNGLFVYLVVRDANAEWIQPTGGLGRVVGSEFSGGCHLGDQKDREKSINQEYECFAVATTAEYSEYQRLDGATVKARSNVVRLLRVE